MDRINGADTFDIGGGKRGFRSENLVAGVAGTEVTDLFLNSIQEELLKVITEAGLVPDLADWSQLWQALKILGLSTGSKNRRWTAATAMTIAAPPANPATGDTYLIPAGASGAWALNIGKIADWTGSAWSYFSPPDGHGIGLPDGRVFMRIAGEYVEWLESRSLTVTKLSRLPWLPVISVTLSSAPGAPTRGDTYLIPTGATGVWAANIGKIAEWTGSAWSYATPVDGHGISLPDGRVFERVGGTYIEKIAQDAQSGKWTTGSIGGTVNAITATLTPTAQSLVAGMSIMLIITTPNTGPTTLNLANSGALPVVNLYGAPLSGRELIGPVRFTYDGAKWWANVFQPVLTANLTFYVNGAAGNDTNNGVTPGTAFKTIQAAVNQAQKINLNGYAISINVADNNYTGPVVLGAVSGGVVTITGNIATPTNCVVSQPVGSSFLCTTGQWKISGFSVSTVSSSGSDPACGVYAAASGAQVNLSDMVFGSCVGAHIYASNGGGVLVSGKISVMGSAPATLLAVVSGTITIQPAFTPELNIPNAFTVSLGFAVVNDLGTIWGRFSTVTGPGATVSGPKYAATRNGVIDTLGAGINHFPGNAVGTTATGGQYA